MYEKILLVQKEIGSIKKDSINPHFKNTYFDINSLLAEVKPVLNKHGLVLIQALTHIEGKLALETILIESEGGARFSSICPLPETVDAQKAGGAITYFRRYALTSLLALEAEDNDGEVFKPVAKKKFVYPTPEKEGIDLSKPPFEDTPVKTISNDGFLD